MLERGEKIHGYDARPYTRRVDRALLEQTLADAGEPAYRAAQVWEWVARGAALL